MKSELVKYFTNEHYQAVEGPLKAHGVGSCSLNPALECGINYPTPKTGIKRTPKVIVRVEHNRVSDSEKSEFQLLATATS